MSEVLYKKAKNRSFPGFLKENESTWNGPFTFIQGADTQFGMIDEYILKVPNPAWEKEIELTETAVKAVNEMSPRPRFFVVCGDLVHAFPGEKDREPQEQAFFHCFKELAPDIPLVCVCGNHDVGNTPTHGTIKSYTDKFGDDYFKFYCGGVMFIVLNSQFFWDPSSVTDLAEEQDKWLEEQIKEAKTGKCRHVIMFQHIPWFLKDMGEEKNYFNLSLELREKWLQKFNNANVKAIFCGHWHGNSGGFYKNVEIVVTSAIGGQLRGGNSGFRVVKVGEDSIKHTYYDLDKVPKNIV